jgi:hypothetical protein
MAGHQYLRTDWLAEAAEPCVRSGFRNPNRTGIGPRGPVQNDAILHFRFAKRAEQGHSELRGDWVESIPVLLGAHEAIQGAASCEVILGKEQNSSDLGAVGQQLLRRAPGAGGQFLHERGELGLIRRGKVRRGDLIAELVERTIPEHLKLARRHWRIACGSKLGGAKALGG